MGELKGQGWILSRAGTEGGFVAPGSRRQMKQKAFLGSGGPDALGRDALPFLPCPSHRVCLNTLIQLGLCVTCAGLSSLS